MATKRMLCQEIGNTMHKLQQLEWELKDGKVLIEFGAAARVQEVFDEVRREMRAHMDLILPFDRSQAEYDQELYAPRVHASGC